MNAIKYISILIDNRDASAETIGLSEYIFRQDNDPNHTANITKQLFAAKGVE